MINRSHIQEGMHVKSLDGKDLGKVTSCNEETFYVEKGLLFSKEYVGSYQEIAEVRGNDVILGSTFDQLKASWSAADNAGEPRTFEGSRAGEANGEITPEERTFAETEAAALEEPAEPAATTGNSATGPEVHESPQYGGTLGYRSPSGERSELYPDEPDPTSRSEGSTEYRIPLYEEELEAVKSSKHRDLHLKKEVITEEQSIKVPVKHEEIRVEHHKVHEPLDHGDETTFEEGEYRVPVYEDEVELYKTPVVSEEVYVTKSVVEEEEEFRAPVRKERLKMDDPEPSRP